VVTPSADNKLTALAPQSPRQNIMSPKQNEPDWLMLLHLEIATDLLDGNPMS